MRGRCAACRGQGGECRICGGTGTIPTTPLVTHACHAGHHRHSLDIRILDPCTCYCHTAIDTTCTEGATT